MNKFAILFGILMVVGMTSTLANGVVTCDSDECACQSDLSVINGQVFSGDTISSPVVVGAEVSVTCNKNPPKTDVTNPSGYYQVYWDQDQCPVGSSITACVGDICKTEVLEDCFENINILGIDLFNVPEFSLIAAGVAFAGAGAGYLFLRRKN